MFELKFFCFGLGRELNGLSAFYAGGLGNIPSNMQTIENHWKKFMSSELRVAYKYYQVCLCPAMFPFPTPWQK